jgi:arginine/lysine/ornithine decarboxylase
VLFLPFERIPAEESVGRILASPGVSCPPAVPIVLCGERIDDKALELFRYYGIETCDVVKE